MWSLQLDVLRLEFVKTHSDLISSAILVTLSELMRGFGCAVPHGM